MIKFKKPSTAEITQKLKHEFWEYAMLVAYLYVTFSALVLYKMTILGAQGVAYLPFGLPAVKALILGKFILLGHAARLGDRFETRRTIHTIAIKSLIYLIMIIVMSILEEVIVGAFKGRTLSASLDQAVGGGLAQTLVMSFIMLLILIPYLASRELNIALGEGRLWAILFERRASPPINKRR